MPTNDDRVVSLRRLILLLGLVVVVLLIALQAQATYLFSDTTDSVEAVRKASGLDLPSLPQLKRWPDTDTGAETSITLFLAPTTAVIPATQPAEAITDPKLEIPVSLTAVVVTSDDRRALLEIGSDRKVVLVREGTLAEGWKVVKIEPDLVTLERGTVQKALYFGDALPDGH